MSVTRKDANQLKKGNYLLVDGEVCRVTSEPQHSKSGKHGHAKMRFDAENIYTGKKSSVVMPAGESVDVPNIEKRTGQVISKSADSVTVMDSENFTNFEVELPNDEEMKNQLAADQTVEYWLVMDKKVIVKIMS
ncbi:MAG TPA: translation initiation factor IF-5A [Candidatus Lokiarchaeia archaeon]|nr:translation initiation factor IF-5A [Candidatus Lokiarchaeia archaeon]